MIKFKYNKSLLFISWVERQNFFTQASAVDVDVDFGGGDTFVSEHLLNGAQVGTPFEQVGGKRVAQGVWAYLFANVGQDWYEIMRHIEPIRI